MKWKCEPKKGAKGTILENFGQFHKHLNSELQQNLAFGGFWVYSQNFQGKYPRSRYLS